MKRLRRLIAALAVSAAVSTAVVVPASARPAEVSGPAAVQSAWVYVARHAVPNIAIRSNPGRPGSSTPGPEVGRVGPGGPLWAYCITDGARLTVWGITSQKWVIVDYNGHDRYVWAGGLVVPDPLDAC